MAEELSKKDEQVIKTLYEGGLNKNIAKVVVFLSKSTETTSRDIERGTNLRQPELSLAMKKIKERGWVKEKENRNKSRGRSTKLYKPTFNLNRVIEEFEKKREESQSTETSITSYKVSRPLERSLKNYVTENVALSYLIEYMEEKGEVKESDLLMIAGFQKLKEIRPHIRNNTVIKEVEESALDFLTKNLMTSYLKMDKKVIFEEGKIGDLYNGYYSKKRDEIYEEIGEAIYKEIERTELRHEEYEYPEIEESTDTKSLFTKPYYNLLEVLSEMEKDKLAKFATILSLMKSEPNSHWLSCIKDFTDFDDEDELRSKVLSDYRKVLHAITDYVDSKFEDFNTLIRLFKLVKDSNTIIDYLIVHSSRHTRTNKIFKKIIILEVKANGSRLSKKQKDFIQKLKREKLDKVEYKLIKVDYKLPSEFELSVNHFY